LYAPQKTEQLHLHFEKGGYMSKEIIERKFTLEGPARLTLSNIRGSVNVQSGEKGVITVTAIKHVDTGDAERTQIRIVQAEDGEVSAKTHFEHAGETIFARGKPCKVDYMVHMPRTCVLRIDCVSSGISVEGLRGAFTLKTVSGLLVLRDLASQITASTVSGDIDGEKLAGTANINTVSGKARLGASNLTSIEASSVSGNFELQTPLQEEGRYRFKTVSGNFRLMLPEKAGCSVDINSLSGKLRSPLSITDRHSRSSYELQGGGPEVRFGSISGNLSIEVTGEARHTETVEKTSSDEREKEARTVRPVEKQVQVGGSTAASQPAPKTRREILDLIARGEISAKDGLTALKGL
jgi:DUF4097 and DUF4098 domain-containing protein YvlB